MSASFEVHGHLPRGRQLRVSPSRRAAFFAFALKEIRRLGVMIERSSFKLPHPDSDEVARDVVSAGESMERLACNGVLGDLPFELDAVGAVLGHGFHSLKAPAAPVNSQPAICPPSGAHSNTRANVE